MAIEVSLHHREIRLSGPEQSLAQAASSRKAMSNEFQAQLATRATTYSRRGSIRLLQSTLEMMIDKYSEQIVYDSLAEMDFWFNYSSGAFLSPGYPPLYYRRTTAKDKPSPNKSAISGIGEGVAGFVMQRSYRATKLARPIHDYPDIVMFDGSNTYLIEAKATTTKSVTRIKRKIDDELIRMSAYASACRSLDPSRTVVGVIIGTALLGIDSYETYVTEIFV